MKRTVRYIFLPILAALFTVLCCSCAKSDTPYTGNSTQSTGEYYSAETPMDGDYVAADKDSGQNESVIPAEDPNRKLVYTLELSLTANDPTAVTKALSAEAERLGGYISNSTSSSDDLGVEACNLTLRVPPSALDSISAMAGELGKVKSSNLYTDEITEEYFDIASRLESAQAQEKVYLDILAKCESVEDILKVRESLASVQEEIEVYKGRLRLWDTQVSFSTANVHISRSPTAAVEGESELIALWKSSDVWARMKSGFTNSLTFIANAFSFVLIALSTLAIPLLIIGVIVVAIVLIVRAARKRRKSNAAQKTE